MSADAATRGDENNLPDESIKTDQPEYFPAPTDFDLSAVLAFSFNSLRSAPQPVMVGHVVRRPSLEEYIARETGNAYRSRAVVGGDEEEVLPDVMGHTDRNLYDAVILETSGAYKIFVKPGQPAEERQAALAETNIPAQHKLDVVKNITAVESHIQYDSDIPVNFVWGDSLTFKIRTELGLHGDFINFHNLNMPGLRQQEEYKSNLTRITVERGTRTPTTKIVMMLAPAVVLYDQLVQSATGLYLLEKDGKVLSNVMDSEKAISEGARIVPVNVKNPRHLNAIDPLIKRSVVDTLLKELTLDLGK